MSKDIKEFVIRASKQQSRVMDKLAKRILRGGKPKWRSTCQWPIWYLGEERGNNE